MLLTYWWKANSCIVARTKDSKFDRLALREKWSIFFLDKCFITYTTKLNTKLLNIFITLESLSLVNSMLGFHKMCWDQFPSEAITYSLIKKFSHLYEVSIVSRYLWKSSDLNTKILRRPKSSFSSQIDFFMLGTTFFHYLGQKHCRKSKLKKFHHFFHPAEALQNCST